MQFLQRLQKYRLPLAFAYLFVISALFCLPGSALPHDDWMSRIWLDKWVHIGFFIALVWLWCWALGLSQKKSFYLLLLLAVLYGFGVEVVQDQFIANRAFDWGDWAADAGGSVAGLWLWTRTYVKVGPYIKK